MIFLINVIGVVFLFKQNTAYEMRISDGSSDVCSSDLSGRRCAASLPNLRHGRAGSETGRRGSPRRSSRSGARAARRLRGSLRPATPGRRGDRADRESVLEGKRETVRVAHGGSGSNKRTKSTAAQAETN